MKVYNLNRYYTCKITSSLCGEDNQIPPKCRECDFYLEWRKSGISIKEFSDIQYCDTCNVQLIKETKADGCDSFGIHCKKCTGQ